jgi:rare lipoprotein A
MATNPPVVTTAQHSHGGGYYLDDGPGANPPANIDAIPDAVPKIEPLRKAANQPYVALGKAYTPNTELAPYHATGLASWYGRRFDGHSTSSGETYDMYAMTAAHCTLPIPSYARVTAVSTGKSVIVRINDRGPFHSQRIIDLSYTAAHKLGLVQGGSGMVEVSAITPADISKGRDLNDSSHGIYLQLGSFDNHDNAEHMLADVATRLDRGSAALVILNHDEHYRVALGPYTDADSADQAEKEVEQQMNLTPFRLVLH